MVKTPSLIAASPDAIAALGARLGEQCEGGETIFLSGCLGAGKTCFIKGLAQGLGIPAALVTSPTFVLHAQYQGEGRLTLNHLDFYRLRDHAAGESDCFFELLSAPAAVCAVEWPEALPVLAQLPALQIEIEILSAASRRLSLLARGERHGALLRRFLASLPTTKNV